MKAHLRQTRISSKKANLVADLVRNMKASEAVDILKFTPKKAAPLLKKLIESAMANAEHNAKQDKATLYIKEIIVTEGPTYKRRVMVSRGRAHPILKRTSHITIKLESKEVPKTTKATKKVKEAEATVKTEETAKPKGKVTVKKSTKKTE